MIVVFSSTENNVKIIITNNYRQRISRRTSVQTQTCDAVLNTIIPSYIGVDLSKILGGHEVRTIGDD